MVTPLLGVPAHRTALSIGHVPERPLANAHHHRTDDLLRFGTASPQKQPPRRNKLLLYLTLGLAAYMGYSALAPQKPNPQLTAPVQPGETIPDANGLLIATPQELMQQIQAGRVKAIEIQAGKTAIEWRVILDNKNVQHFVPNPQQPGYTELVQSMREKGLHPQVKDESQVGAIFLMLAIQLLPLALIGYLAYRMMSGMAGRGGFSALQSHTTNANAPKVTLDHVAGIPEVVHEIRADILNLFNDRESRVGERLPSGILLEGPPGTGKTLLAKAIAGELNRPFFSLSGSDFVELFVGMGARRVRDLFATARKHAPSVIFIDEIDAIGKKRGGAGPGVGGHDEREQTLNAILSEMDGFNATDDVLVIAATNRAETLDKALVRPGRFDKKYTVTPPMTPEGRRDILNVHLRNKKVADDVDSLFIARRMWPGTSGAEIEKIANEAALLARRRDKTAIERQDFLDAIERIYLGLPKKDVAFTPEDKRRVAVHETLGHAAVAWALGLPVQFLTVVPRNMEGGGTALGIMGTDPEGMPKYHQTRQFVEKMACMIMGGRAAEEALYGKDNVSSGASNDWAKVNQLMKEAIETSALYPERFGQVIIPPSDNPFAHSDVSPALKEKGESVRNDLLSQLYETTVAFIKAIPPEAREKIIARIEQEETMNDPVAIREMFQTSGVADWRALWEKTLASRKADTQKPA